MGAAKTEVLIVAGIALAAIYLAQRAAAGAGAALASAVPYVDPTSDKNIAYQGTSAFMRLLTGNTTTTDTVGTMLWDFAHKGEPDPSGTGVINYTAAQQAADQRATQQLEAGFHGM